jgi:hypothetical protein
VHGTGVTLRGTARSITPASGEHEGGHRCEASQQQEDQPPNHDQRRRGARRARLLLSLYLRSCHARARSASQTAPGDGVPGGTGPETDARTP